MNQKRIDWDFAYHVTDKDRDISQGLVRQKCALLANYINDNLPNGREKSLAITGLEEVMFWANAALARADRPEDAK